MQKCVRASLRACPCVSARFRACVCVCFGRSGEGSLRVNIQPVICGALTAADARADTVSPGPLSADPVVGDGPVVESDAGGLGLFLVGSASNGRKRLSRSETGFRRISAAR